MFVNIGKQKKTRRSIFYPLTLKYIESKIYFLCPVEFYNILKCYFRQWCLLPFTLYARQIL